MESILVASVSFLISKRKEDEQTSESKSGQERQVLVLDSGISKGYHFIYFLYLFVHYILFQIRE